MSQAPSNRLSAYIDGFNLYYYLKNTPYRWLNLKALLQRLFPDKDIVSIKYFTAKVKDNERDPQALTRQLIYLDALRTLQELELIEGNFSSGKKPKYRPYWKDQSLLLPTLHTEEKGSDVNLAVHLLHDAHKNVFDTAVVISNDSDFVEAIRLVKEELNKAVHVIAPCLEDEKPAIDMPPCLEDKKPAIAFALKEVATKIATLKDADLKESCFPEYIPGTTLHRPEGWEHPKPQPSREYHPLIVKLPIEKWNELKHYVENIPEAVGPNAPGKAKRGVGRWAYDTLRAAMKAGHEPMNVLAVIPARYASTRFPGKPLVDIGGKPMIQHVWERVMQVAEVARVLVATDDERIAQAVQAFGGEVCLTSPAHVSGTDRVWEVAAQYPDYNAILNVQGDEPFISPACLGQAIAALARQAEADMVTAVCPLNLQVPLDRSHWQDANVVKAVLSDSGQALYFSRSPIPAVREAADLDRVGVPVYRHLGLYLYRRAALERFTQLPPHPLELAERLEQLRALAAGMRIATILLAEAPVGIDTPDDLERVLAQLPALMQEKMIPVL